MRRVIVALCIVCMLPVFGEFSRTSGLIDIPKADVLPHLGYRFGFDGSVAVGTGDRNDGTDVNFHSALGLYDRFEVYVDVYTFSNFTAAAGFCHRVMENDKLALAWGVHQLSYALDVSEIGHGDSIGWDDDLSYNRGDYDKPFELGSAYLVATYNLTTSVSATVGIGRGRYCGYGTHSRHFNTNFYHEEGGDWGIGLLAGLNVNITDELDFMLEGDSRDLSTGFKFTKNQIELGLALTKFEFYLWPDDGEFNPRIAASMSYLGPGKKSQPVFGMITGTVHDEDGNPVTADIMFPNTGIAPVTADPVYGLYSVVDVEPGLYSVSARAAGYLPGDKKVTVESGRSTACDFVLASLPPALGGIVGMVVDFQTDEPVRAVLTLTEKNLETTTTSTGIFEYTNLEPKAYEIQARAETYEPGIYSAEVTPGEITDIVIKMVQRKTSITFEDIFFDFSLTEIKPEFFAALDEAGKILVSHKDITVELQGHTDATGTEEFNLQLSIDRAAAVRVYLAENHGIDPSRFVITGFGESQPVSPNDSRENRAKNRRVIFIIE